MNKEEKKLLKIFIEKCQKYDETVEIKGVSVGEESRILDTVVKALNLIQKQDKIIDKMAEEILKIDTAKSKFEYDHAKVWDTEKGIKEYFKKVVDKDVKD